MDISLMHAGLAAGAALAALPVILHLFMKQKPKHIVFPALRLIRERQKRAKKQLKIKNWLLLALRMLVLALMALALARPTLNSEVSLGVGEVPTALALVFDTSTSMGYTERGKDRLAEAKERAAEILKRSTDDSEVFVLDSADPVKPNPLTPASALRRINDLAIRPANRPLNQALVLGHQVVAESKLARREVYVLTDGTAGAWEVPSPGTTEALARIEKAKTKVRTYVLRLGPKEAHNIAVAAAEPSSITPSEGEPVEVAATVRAVGPGGERVLEFYLDGEKNKKDQKAIRVPDNGEVSVTFATTGKLAPGLHQGMVKLRGEPDPLALDDVRFFTFNSEPATRVLLVADAAADAEYVADALAPTPAGGAGGAGDPTAAPLASFRVDRQTLAQFRARPDSSLDDYAAIFLLNVDRPSPQDWGRLRTYVSGGGGLVVAPGDRADPASYDNPAAGPVMPGLIDGEPTGKDTTFAKAEYSHPLFSRFPRLIDPELAQVPIYRHWPIKVDKDARVLLRFADGGPALVERIVRGTRTGRVLLWATPLARRVSRGVAGAWNEFPMSWSFLSLMLETIPYLAGTAGEQLNYEAGQPVVLNIDPGRRAANYSVQGPDPKLTDRLSVPPTADSVPVPGAGAVGHWRVEGQAAADAPRQVMGFSINPPASESRVATLREGDLDGLFGGKDRYGEADDPKNLQILQDKGRHGSELFPLLMFLILGLVTAENLLANKFHRESGRP